VLKVFLVDMHDLTGVFQGLSFIGLGIVLLGIGWLYQRVLFPRQEPFRLDPAREKGHGQWPKAFRPVKHGCKFRWDGVF